MTKPTTKRIYVRSGQQALKWLTLIIHKRHILHSARYAAASQSTNEVFLLIKLSVALVRNNVCSLKMIELSKHVGAN
jgi:hypothetical protein